MLNRPGKPLEANYQLEMPKAAFDTWVRNAEFVSYEDGSFIIGVSNAYARDWLQSRLSSTVTRLLTGIMNRTVEVRFVVWHNGHEPVEESRKTSQKSEEIAIRHTEPQPQRPLFFREFCGWPEQPAGACRFIGGSRKTGPGL